VTQDEMNWQHTTVDIEGLEHEAYTTGLPSGIHIQVVYMDDRWYGFVYPTPENCYLTHDAFEQTPAHGNEDDAKADIIKRLYESMAEDMAAMQVHSEERDTIDAIITAAYMCLTAHFTSDDSFETRMETLDELFGAFSMVCPDKYIRLCKHGAKGGSESMAEDMAAM